VGFAYDSIGNPCKQRPERERERERGEVGGSEINVPSFLPSFQRQARIIVSPREGSGESTRLRRLKVARQMM